MNTMILPSRAGIPLGRAAILVSLLLAACKPATTTPESRAPAVSVPEAPVQDASLVPTRTIEINVDNSMKYSVTEITAQPDEVLKITLHNVGTLPKAAMGHNFVLLDSAANIKDFANAAALSPGTGYIPPQYLSWILARIKLLGGGESDSVVFAAPHVAGTYHYLCTYPGHLQNGAAGVLKVQN
jgi:azurin